MTPPSSTPCREGNEAGVISATVTPYKCDNPNHDKGCGLGWRLVECEEAEAHTWIAAIDVGNRRVWSCSNVQSQSRDAATAALLNRLSEGVQHD
jgi:Zn-finger protein